MNTLWRVLGFELLKGCLDQVRVLYWAPSDVGLGRCFILCVLLDVVVHIRLHFFDIAIDWEMLVGVWHQ